MLRSVLSLFLLIVLSLPVDSQELKVVFMGDIMGHDSQIASALATGEKGYDYKPCFENIRPWLQGKDLVIGNLEVTFAGPPYKGYPAFSSPDELGKALKWAGFDILVNANNHGLDKGKRGLLRTLDMCDSLHLVQTGTFSDSEDRARRYPLIVEKEGIRLAILNFTYGTNGIKDRPPTIINRIDTAQIKRDLEKAKTALPDLILVCAHWGSEYQRNENSAQRSLAAFLFKHGADAIIGSHPHVIQPVKGSQNGDLVAYSLGNLISNQRTHYRDGGLAFEIEVVKEKDSTYIAGHSYLPLWVWKPITKKGTGFTLVSANMAQDSELYLKMPAEDRKKMKLFYDDTRTHLKSVDIQSVDVQSME